MESSPSHAVNFCRDSCLDIPPWPPCTPFFSLSPLLLSALLFSLCFQNPLVLLSLSPLFCHLFLPSYVELAWGAAERVKPARSHGCRSVGGLMHGKVPFWHAEL